MLIMKAILFPIVALAVPALAQITVKNALATHWKTSGEFMLAVASAMPADGYTFPGVSRRDELRPTDRAYFEC